MNQLQTSQQDRLSTQTIPEFSMRKVRTGTLPVLKQPHLLSRGGFGLNEVIGIAAGIIIAVVVVIPGLRQFAASVLGQLTQWWNNMASGIFSN